MSASRRVLIVDDDMDVRLGLKALLRALGHEVQEAESGEEALAEIVALRPDVSLIDLGMNSGMDGHELARRIRAQPEIRALRLVALTGHGARADRERAMSAGFDAYLVKPVSEQDLLDALESPKA